MNEYLKDNSMFEPEKLTSIDKVPFLSDNYHTEYYGIYDKKHCIVIYYRNAEVPEIIFE